LTKTKVLFLCTGNSARSQMAEAFLRGLGGERFEAFSAGLEPKGLNPLTVQVMQEIGYDVAGQRSKGIDEYLGKEHFHYLITVCHDAEENCPRVWPGVQARIHWSFEDPAAIQGSEAERSARFRQVRDQIQEQVENWIDEVSRSSAA
jgi:arsenate reductase